jgi:hypothetical protein
MSIQMVCPNIQCKRIHSFPNEARGQVIRCIRCEMEFRIPALPAPAPPKRHKTQDELIVEEELRVAAAACPASPI